MKFVNFLVGIYITVSVVLISLPYIYECIPNKTIYDWYCNNYELVDKLCYINFIIAYTISSILFYINGYNDGKEKENITKNINMDK